MAICKNLKHTPPVGVCFFQVGVCFIVKTGNIGKPGFFRRADFWWGLFAGLDLIDRGRIAGRELGGYGEYI